MKEIYHTIISHFSHTFYCFISNKGVCDNWHINFTIIFNFGRYVLGKRYTISSLEFSKVYIIPIYIRDLQFRFSFVFNFRFVLKVLVHCIAFSNMNSLNNNYSLQRWQGTTISLWIRWYPSSRLQEQLFCRWYWPKLFCTGILTIPVLWVICTFNKSLPVNKTYILRYNRKV